MSWNIAQAKQHFSEVVRLSVQEPQAIYNRGELVAAVVDAKTLEVLAQYRRATQPRTLAEEFAELRGLCAGEDYELELPPRADSGRSNAFARLLQEEADGDVPGAP